jgi:hypothetical protein
MSFWLLAAYTCLGVFLTLVTLGAVVARMQDNKMSFWAALVMAVPFLVVFGVVHLVIFV